MSNTVNVITGRNTSNGEWIVVYSTDGLTFTVESNLSATLAQDTFRMQFLEHNGSNWFMGGLSNQGLVNAGASLYTSTDGSNWSTLSLPTLNENEELRSLATNSTVSIAVTNCNSFLVTTDYVTWTPVTNSPIVSNSVANTSHYVVRGSVTSPMLVSFYSDITITTGTSVLSNMLYNSTDGITWTENTELSGMLNSIQLNQSYAYIRVDDVNYNGSMWVGLVSTVTPDADVSMIYTITSSNAITWSLHSNIQTTQVLGLRGSRIGFSDSLWVIGNTFINTDSNSMMYSPNSIIYSSNGIEWTGVPIVLSNSEVMKINYTGVKWNGARWVASGKALNDGGDSYVVSSEDANNWVINTELSDIFQQGSFNSDQFSATSYVPIPQSNTYTYQSALLAPVPSDPVEKANYFAALTNNFIDYNSSTSVGIDPSSNIFAYYTNLGVSIPEGSSLVFLPTSNGVVADSVIESLSTGQYVLFPDNYSITIAGSTYAMSNDSFTITTGGVPTTVATNGLFTINGKTLQFLTAGSPALTLVTETGGNAVNVITGRNFSNGEWLVMYSTDGLTFTVESNISATLTQDTFRMWFLEHNGSNWIMGGLSNQGLVGAGASLYTSTDGSNWSTLTLPTLNENEDLRSLATNSNVSIAVTNCNSFLRTSDYVTWTPVTNSPIVSNSVANISYYTVRGSVSTPMMVSFYSDSTLTTGTSVLSNMLYNSTDGITWTENTDLNGMLNSIQINDSNASNASIRVDDINYNGSMWVGLVSTFTPQFDVSNIYTITSSNAITWSLHSNIQSSLLRANTGSRVTFSDMLWVIGNTGINTDSNSMMYSPNSIIYSSNGIEWTGVPIVLSNSQTMIIDYTGVTWNGALWVATGRDDSNNSYVVSSDDAINWVMNTAASDIFQQGNFTVDKFSATSYVPVSIPTSNSYTYESALLSPVPSDPVDKANYFAAITNHFSNYNSSTAVTVSSSNLINYYRTLDSSIPADAALRFLPASNGVVLQSVIASLSNGDYAVFPDNYPILIAGKTYTTSSNSLIITASGVPTTVSPNGSFMIYTKTLQFLTAGSPAVTVVTATASNPPCFLEGTKILCLVGDKEEYVAIESLAKGTFVKTLVGYRPVTHLGYSKMSNSGLDTRERTQLYVCSPDKYPTLTEPLYITGCHSILVDDLTEKQRGETENVYGTVFVTNNKYRLEAYLDDRASPWSEKGEFTVWHVCLEHEKEQFNYGIYANGLLVESISKRAITMFKTLTLI